MFRRPLSIGGFQRLYLGANEKKALASFHRYMAQYYDGLSETAADGKPALRHRTG